MQQSKKISDTHTIRTIAKNPPKKIVDRTFYAYKTIKKKIKQNKLFNQITLQDLFKAKQQQKIKPFFIPDLSILDKPGFHCFTKVNPNYKKKQKLKTETSYHQNLTSDSKSKSSKKISKNYNFKLLDQSLAQNKHTIHIIQSHIAKKRTERLYSSALQKPQQIKTKLKVLNRIRKKDYKILKQRPYFLIRLHLKHCQVQGWKPQFRLGQSLSICNSSLYVINGQTNDHYGDISLLSIKQNQLISKQIPNEYIGLKQSKIISNCKWELISSGLSNYRSYHTSEIYKNTIILLCGLEKQQDNRRICTNKCLFYDLSLNKYYFNHNSGQEDLQPRYKHSTVLINKFIYLIGGLDRLSQSLDDFWRLDLQIQQWNKLDISYNFGWNISTIVFSTQKQTRRLQQWQGIYVFSFNMGLLQINLRTSEVRRISTQVQLLGKAFVSMLFIQKFMILVISFMQGFFVTYYLVDKKWRVYKRNLGNAIGVDETVWGVGGRQGQFFTGGLRKVIFEEI